MGEYASYGGETIKIGTCEDMYYLRASQAGSVFPQRGNVNPASPADQKVIRFRFPWPDEDGTEPGAYDDHDRAVTLQGEGIAFPEGLEHYSVQFVAQAGYLLSLPCPEGTPDARIHRNGFAGRVRLVQQAYRNGHLALIGQCGGCGARFNVPTWEGAEPWVVACRAEADRNEKRGESRHWWDTVADRIAAGYGQ